MKYAILRNKKVISSLLWRGLSWHLNYIFTKNPRPLACSFYITSKCNFKCNFCNIWRRPITTTLPYSKAKGIVDSLSDLGCFYFSITGGEPLLVDYLFDLLMHARKSKIKYLHLVTNGYLLDGDSAYKFEDTGIDEISISIDGTEEFHNRNRGLPGSYRKAIQAIGNLKKYAPDIKIVLNAIFSPQDPFECLHVVDIAREFNIYLKVQPLNQHPMFNKDNHSVVSIGNILPQNIKDAIARLRKEDCVINSEVFLVNIYNFFCQKQDLIFKDSPCLFGYHHIEILEDGSIFPCLEGLDWKEGISFDKGLRELIYSKAYRGLLEKLRDCKGCQRSYYICYYEPRITFPINNLLKTKLPI